MKVKITKETEYEKTSKTKVRGRGVGLGCIGGPIRFTDPMARIQGGKDIMRDKTL